MADDDELRRGNGRRRDDWVGARPLDIGYVIQRERYGRRPEVVATGLSWKQGCEMLDAMPEDYVMRLAGAPRKAYRRIGGIK